MTLKTKAKETHSQMDKGIIYNVSGEEYIEKAVESAQSVKRHNDLHITVFTNKIIDEDVFDEQILIGDPIESMGDSILSNKHIIYQKNGRV